MYTGTNKTARNSQRIFLDTLEQLLREKDFSKISISELCDASGVSRQTFYSLFGTKENILRYAIAHNYAYPRDIRPPAGSNLARFLAHIFSRYIDANYDFLHLLVKSNLIYVFYQCLTDWLMDLRGQLFHNVPEERQQYFCIYVSGTVTGVISAYIQESVHRDTQYLEDLMYDMFSGEAFQMPCLALRA